MASTIADNTASGVAGWGVSTDKDCKQLPFAVKRPNLIPVPPKSIPITCFVIVSCQLSVVSCQLSVVSCQLSVVSG
ncbi:MAG: hypothetical protein ACKPHZ_02585 [Dolichospermum sp.]